MTSSFNRMCDNIGRRLTTKAFLLTCAATGPFSAIFFILCFVIGNMIPPPSPSMTAQETVNFYRHNHERIAAGAGMFMIGGALYIPFIVAISVQIRRIPNLHYGVSWLQLGSGCVGSLTYIFPAINLAVTNYNLGRPIEITQSLNEQFWLSTFLPIQTFVVQNWFFAWAVLADTRRVPLFPKWMIIPQIITPIVFLLGMGIMTAHKGAFSWHGAITFWLVSFGFLGQILIDTVGLWIATLTPALEGEPLAESVCMYSVARESEDSEQPMNAKQHA
ncbi:hypothetical protein RQP46_010315 [Phenoliferia psychrophenolica]